MTRFRRIAGRTGFTFALATMFMFVATPAHAALTPAQERILVNAIHADPALAALVGAYPYNSDSAFEIARQLNTLATPDFTVWKTQVAITKVGDNIVATELAALSATNLTRLQTIALLSPGGVNPSLADRRAFFDDVFSGPAGASTRVKLLVLWKRLATRVEALFATGAGSDASPATMTFEGKISTQDVLDALICVAQNDCER